MTVKHVPGLALLILASLIAKPFAESPNFESPPVHPLEISQDGDFLYAVHTADHRLVIYYVGGGQPVKNAEIMVGLEPVTVRLRGSDEAWVVNHISDSISLIDLRQRSVIRTLLVGDEPTDVVFTAGRAFVCVSQEDLIRVYDLGNLSAPPIDIPLEASDPRSLALSPDGSTLYVAVLDSGNKTTAIHFEVVDAFGGPPPPNPPMNPSLPPAPRTSLIVQHDGANWVDETGGNWNAAVPFTMPDNDVVAISTSALTVTGAYHGVGTTLFNVAVHPVSGDLYVSNQDTRNLVRFEPNLKGRFLFNNMARIVPSTGSVTLHHLNDHIDYGAPGGNDGERAMSLAIPLDVTISSTGNEVYVAAFGSRKVGVLDGSGNVTRRITVGEGPAGLALDEARNRLYVLNRFSSSFSMVDLDDDSSVEVPLGYDPSPIEVLDGRKFLYDGEISSAHGDLSCASCHLFGGMDNIAWDLGDPTGSMIPVPPGQIFPLPDFHPMKGPMTTQSLKGLQGTEPLHWRGDRGGFNEFNPAFVGLMGKAAPLSTGDFQRFEDFVFTIRYPSNPFRELDGSLPSMLNGADPIHGEQLYLTGDLVGGLQCVTCHALPTGENGLIITGAALQEDEAKVVPQLRNMYEKTRFSNRAAPTVRGYGFIHDGSVDNLFSFLQFPAFTFNNDSDRRDVEAFLLAFDTGTHPAVGAQWTMDGSNEPAGIGRLNMLEAEADVGAIGLVAKGLVAGQARGWTYAGAGIYTPDKASEADINQSMLLSMAGAGSEITFTGVVDGCEWRLGVDRDLDGFRDGDELDAGSDPGDPASTPDSPTTGIPDVAASAPSALWLAGANPAYFRARFGFSVGAAGPARMDVYDVRGRLVRHLVNDGRRNTGTYFQEWDLRNSEGRTVSSGIYFVRLETADVIQVQRVTVVR